MYDLERFKSAQSDRFSGIDTALSELRAGRKRGHWIWYVLPQLRGLGQSTMASRYGLDGVGEADAYLRDPELRRRLLDVVEAVDGHLQNGGANVASMMGSEIDALKLVSSMTLFGAVARRLSRDAPAAGAGNLDAIARHAESILGAAARQGFPPCEFTRRTLAGAGF